MGADLIQMDNSQFKALTKHIMTTAILNCFID